MEFITTSKTFRVYWREAGRAAARNDNRDAEILFDIEPKVEQARWKDDDSRRCALTFFSEGVEMAREDAKH